MMNEIFKNKIWDMLDVYMDDMIVKLKEELDHIAHQEAVFT